MGKSGFRILHLIAFCPAEYLSRKFDRHSHTRRPDGMTEALQSSFRIDGKFPIDRGNALSDQIRTLPKFTQTHILIIEQLRKGETVVNNAKSSSSIGLVIPASRNAVPAAFLVEATESPV